MNLSETKQILTISQITPGSRFVISIAYFVKVSSSAPPWLLLPDSPFDIDHSTRWIACTTELSSTSFPGSFLSLGTRLNFLQWNTRSQRWSQGSRFRDFNRLFLQSITFGAPWQLLPDSHPDIDHSPIWIVHSTEISRIKTYSQNGVGWQVLCSIVYFFKV